jgi:hypothetical protein
MRLIATFLMLGLGTSCATTEGLQPTSAELGAAGDPQDWPEYEGCTAAGYTPIEWPAGTGQWVCPCPDHTAAHPHVVFMHDNQTDPIFFRDAVLRACNPIPDPDPDDPGSTN